MLQLLKSRELWLYFEFWKIKLMIVVFPMDFCGPELWASTVVDSDLIGLSMATARWQEFPKFACYIVTCLLPPLRGWAPPDNPSNSNNNHFLGWLVGFLRWYLFWSQFLASLYQKSASHRWDKKTYPNNLSNLKFASAAVTSCLAHPW